MNDLVKLNVKNYAKVDSNTKESNDNSKMFNAFTDALFTKDTYTTNGAITHSTTGSLIVDDFANSGAYRNRNMDEVFSDMNSLWNENSKWALSSIFYLRMISRKIKGFIETESVQKGQGNKDESFRRLLWLAYNQPEVFYKNIWLLPVIGTWKDLFSLLSIDYANGINKKIIFELIQKGLEDKYNANLVKKYLPSLKSKSKLKSDKSIILNQLGHELRKFLGLSEKEYRKMKSSGEAHTFQKQISNGLFEEIDFAKISGKALSLMASGNFLSNQNLEDKFLKWLGENDTIKFNGYPFELMNSLNKSNSLINKFTVNKQFEQLVSLAKESPLNGNILPVLDTSGSMSSLSTDDKTTVIDICLSLGVYFSTINEGAFKNVVCMFDDTSYTKKLSGTFADKIYQIRQERTAWGSTNFESVINMLVKMRKENPEIPLEDYPETLLVVSDMNFNPVKGNVETNYEHAMSKLKEVGIENMKFVWWRPDAPKNKNQPAKIEDEGTFFMSGFDGSTISILLGGEEKIDESGNKITPSMEEKLEEAYTQEVLNQLYI